MTMRSSIRISEKQMEEFEENQCQLIGQRQVQDYLEHSAPISSESQSIHYQGADPNLVMQVIDTVVPGTVRDFIKNELLGKMDITTYDWATDMSGLPRAGDRSSMTSRAMLNLVTLAMNKGKWNGEQPIPEAFVAKAINRIIRTSDDEMYGGGEGVSNSGYGHFW
ncbi:MAG TPA: hypothetical protein VKA94_10740, partial [Hyphomicrobiales bacterium]|nr:hypothetical protein [Hyphomicrobiales bacterium]